MRCKQALDLRNWEFALCYVAGNNSWHATRTEPATAISYRSTPPHQEPPEATVPIRGPSLVEVDVADRLTILIASLWPLAAEA
jgi:hypothetical protein